MLLLQFVQYELAADLELLADGRKFMGFQNLDDILGCVIRTSPTQQHMSFDGDAAGCANR
jgi:hypothetical protein